LVDFCFVLKRNAFVTSPMLDIKPAHKPIKEYFDELARILSHGHGNEMSVRNAFQDLLQTLSKRMQWQFIEEYAIKRKGRRDAWCSASTYVVACERQMNEQIPVTLTNQHLSKPQS